jgi:ATP-dependent DNA helicase DinG
VSASQRTVASLHDISYALGGTPRTEQQRFAAAIAQALEDGRDIEGDAATGSGKGLAYLTAALEVKKVEGGRTLVVTNTIGLQNQLVRSDLPICKANGYPDVTFGALYGKGKYVCHAKAVEIFADRDTSMKMKLKATEALSHPTGEQDSFSFTKEEWKQLSIAPDECPGAKVCAYGSQCRFEKAKQRADELDVLVVNQHMFGAFIATQGRSLETDDTRFARFIIDEAQDAPDTVAAMCGGQISPERLYGLAGSARAAFDNKKAPEVETLFKSAAQLTNGLGGGPVVFETGELANQHFGELFGTLLRFTGSVTKDKSSLKDSGAGVRFLTQMERLGTDLAVIITETRVRTWADSSGFFFEPSTVGGQIRAVLGDRPMVAVSGTPTKTMGSDLGMRAKYAKIKVESPFTFDDSLIFVPDDVPAPNVDRDAWEKYVKKDFVRLAKLAGGNAMMLATSMVSVNVIADACEKAGLRTYRQDQMPKEELLAAYTADTGSVLVVTRGLWHGTNIPGRSLIGIDRLPMPTPTDIRVRFKREDYLRDQPGKIVFASEKAVQEGKKGAKLKTLKEATAAAHKNVFKAIDVSIAWIALRQAIGRLHRNTEDDGLVVVYDPRLMDSSYAAELQEGIAIPFTRDRVAAENLLKARRRWLPPRITAA